MTFLGAAALPIPVCAQQSAMPLIGYLGAQSAFLFATRVRAFHQGLKEAGFVEGHNVAVQYRWADGQYDRLPEMAADLVRRQVAVIAATGGVAPARAAKAATTIIPIVFEMGIDPVQAGLVASWNQPGGNLTGVTSLNVTVGPKRVELMRELVPAASVVGLLINPTNQAIAESNLRDGQTAGRNLGLQIETLNASNERELDNVFTTLAQARIGALVIGPDFFFTSQSEQLGKLALRHAIPTIYYGREFTAAGGLISYGGSVAELHRQTGAYTGRILKGDKVSDLPVQQITKVELILNLTTAKALGITVAPTLLARADEVIE